MIKIIGKVLPLNFILILYFLIAVIELSIGDNQEGSTLWASMVLGLIIISFFRLYLWLNLHASFFSALAHTVTSQLMVKFIRKISLESFWAIIRGMTERKRLFETFRQTGRNYQSIIENFQDGATLFDVSGRLIECNPGFEKITGLAKNHIVGKTFWELYANLAHDDTVDLIKPDQLKEYLPILLRENQEQLPPIKIRRLDGAERVVQLSTFTIKNSRTPMVGGIVRDVTKQVLTEQKLIRYTQRLEILYEIDRDILRAESLKELAEVTLIKIRRLVKCHRASISIFEHGYSLPIILSVDLDGEMRLESGEKLSPNDYRLPDGFEDGKEFLVDDLFKSPVLPDIYQDIVKEGIRSYLSIPLLVQGELIGSINLGAGTGGYFNQELIDITRQVANHFAIAACQVRLHEELGENREQLRQLAKRLVLIQEEERRHLSRELHDDAGQDLTALKIMLGLISEDLPSGNSQVQSRLKESIALTNTVMEKIRSLAQGLRPPALDAIGLIPTLEVLCNEFSRRTNIPVKFDGGQTQPLSEPFNICIYRILQEALTNIAKHAGARQVQVQLIRDGEIIYFSIADDGIGFSQNGLSESDYKGMGLVGIQERLEALGGYFQIQTGKGEGTRIIATIPCEEGFHDKSVDCR